MSDTTDGIFDAPPPATAAVPKIAVYFYHAFKLRPCPSKLAVGKESLKIMLGGFRESIANGVALPTIAMEPRGLVPGEIFMLTPDELAELDGAEDAYRRLEVNTKYGKAWAYVLKGVRMANHAN